MHKLRSYNSWPRDIKSKEKWMGKQVRALTLKIRHILSQSQQRTATVFLMLEGPTNFTMVGEKVAIVEGHGCLLAHRVVDLLDLRVTVRSADQVTVPLDTQVAVHSAVLAAALSVVEAVVRWALHFSRMARLIADEIVQDSAWVGTATHSPQMSGLHWAKISESGAKILVNEWATGDSISGSKQKFGVRM
jgi:hypothetical protein